MKATSRIEDIKDPIHLIEEGYFVLSEHATKRMSQRSIDLEQVELVLTHGRLIRSRRACFYVVGRKEVKRCEKQGVDLRLEEDIQIVVDEQSNTVLTVYKNRNFRQIRPQHRRERRLN